MLKKLWSSRQFRITHRPIHQALLMRNEPGSPEEIAKKATEHAIAELNEFMAFERRQGVKH